MEARGAAHTGLWIKNTPALAPSPFSPKTWRIEAFGATSAAQCVTAFGLFTICAPRVVLVPCLRAEKPVPTMAGESTSSRPSRAPKTVERCDTHAQHHVPNVYSAKATTSTGTPESWLKGVKMRGPLPSSLAKTLCFVRFVPAPAVVKEKAEVVIEKVRS